MSDRYLLHRPSGVVYIYASPWIDNPEFIEVADASGTPLRSQPAPAKAAAPRATKVAAKKKAPAKAPAAKTAKAAAKKAVAAPAAPAAPAAAESTPSGDPLADALSVEASRGLP